MDARSCFSIEKSKRQTIYVHNEHISHPTYISKQCKDVRKKRSILLFKSHRIFIMKFHLRAPCGWWRLQSRIGLHIKSNLISDDIKSNSPWHWSERLQFTTEAWRKTSGRLLHRTNVDLNLIPFSIRYRFLYWRVCCYVCTREPKKNKKRQMIRRETYRQQQQLALQDRPA